MIIRPLEGNRSREHVVGKPLWSTKCADLGAPNLATQTLDDLVCIVPSPRALKFRLV